MRLKVKTRVLPPPSIRFYVLWGNVPVALQGRGWGGGRKESDFHCRTTLACLLCTYELVSDKNWTRQKNTLDNILKINTLF